MAEHSEGFFDVERNLKFLLPVVSGFNFHYGNLSDLPNARDLKNANATVVKFFSVGVKGIFICREIDDNRTNTPTVPGKFVHPPNLPKLF